MTNEESGDEEGEESGDEDGEELGKGSGCRQCDGRWDACRSQMTSDIEVSLIIIYLI